MASGLAIAILAPVVLSPVEQGYFFTFLSLSSLQGLFELGISTLLIQNFAHLKGQIEYTTSDFRSSLVSERGTLLVFARDYFRRASILFSFIVGAGGFAFFFISPGAGGVTVWIGPWVLLIIGTAISLRNLSEFSLIDGSGLVRESYQIRTRTVCVLFGIFVIAILLGFGLYAHPIALLASQAYSYSQLKRRVYLAGLGYSIADVSNNEKFVALRKHQKRFAVSAIAGFFTANSITPYAFYVLGPTVAGRVGLSTSMFVAAASLAMAFSTADAPKYGRLLGLGRTAEVYQAWKVNVTYSLACAIFLSILLVLGNVFIQEELPSFASKILGWPAFLCLALMVLANTTLTTVSTVLRSFRREDLMWPSVIAAIFSTVLQFMLQVRPEYYFLSMGVYNGIVFLPFAYVLMMQRVGQRQGLSPAVKG